MAPEDFSFPKITYPLPNFAISPSLWRVSSVVYPDHYQEDSDNHDQAERRSKSLSYLENDDDDVQVMKRELCEEKMDMLWEDFNEELQRVSESSMDEKKSAEVVRLSSSENMSRTGNGVMACHNKRPSNSMVVVMKVLKKIFLNKNSSRRRFRLNSISF